MGEQVGAGFWGCSSVGRAPALQAGGQGFESLHLHVNNEESRATDKHGRTAWTLAYDAERPGLSERILEEYP